VTQVAPDELDYVRIDNSLMNAGISALDAAERRGLKVVVAESCTGGLIASVLSEAPGVTIVDNPEANHFPMPLEASGQDDVLVGRIRQDISREDGRGIDLFVAGDQIRKGAASNAVQIAEKLI